MIRHVLIGTLIAALSPLAYGAPSADAEYPIPGTTRVVVRIEGAGRTSHIVGGTLVNSDFTDHAKSMRVIDEDYEYRHSRGYVRIPGAGPSRRMLCAGRVLKTIWPGMPEIRLAADEFGAKLIKAMGGQGPLNDAVQVGDIVWWSLKRPGETGTMHVSIVTKVLGADRIVIETKDGNESTFELTCSDDPNELSNHIIVPGPDGNAIVQGDILLRRYGSAWRYRLPPGLTARWFHWTPNWTDKTDIDSVVNGIDLSGTWQKLGAPDVRYRIEQTRWSEAFPLVITSAEGSRRSVGGFEDGGTFFMSNWDESGAPTLRHRAEFTVDRIDFIANSELGTKAETWQRAPDSGHVTYTGVWYDRYGVTAPTETTTGTDAIKQAGGGRIWNHNTWEWMPRKTIKSAARITVDLQTGKISGELEYVYEDGGDSGGPPFSREVRYDLDKERLDPVAYINQSGLHYVSSGALTFSRGVDIQLSGLPALRGDFALAGMGRLPTAEEARSGAPRFYATPFAVLHRQAARPQGGPSTSPPTRTLATIQSYLAQGEPAIYVKDILQNPKSHRAPSAVDGGTGRRGDLVMQQVLGRNSLIETRGAKVGLAIVLPGDGDMDMRSIHLSLLEGTTFDAGNFTTNIETLDLMLRAGGSELSDNVSLRLATKLVIRLSTPRVSLTHVGTRYAVHHDPATNETVVQVFEGTVRCAPTDPPGPPLTLTSGQQVVVDAKGPGPIGPIDPAAIPGAGTGPGVATGPGAGGAPGGSARFAPAAPGSPVAVRRTMVYHQLPTDPVAGGVEPVISEQGNRIVFAPEAYPCPIKVIDFDGSNMRTVLQTDRVPGLLDISDDGSRVLAVHNSREIYVAEADGSGTRELVRYHDPEIGHVRLTGDGRRVFLFFNRQVRLAGQELMPDGLWVMNATGGGFRQVVGQDAMRAVLGIAANEGVAWNRQSLDVSRDGAHIVFGVVSYGAANAGPKILVVRDDGSDLRVVAEGIKDNRGQVGSAAITADGRRIAYKIAGWGGEAFVGSANWDGSDVQILSKPSSRFRYPDGNSVVQQITLSRDGAWLLLGATGTVVATDGSDIACQLPATRAGAGKILMYGGLSRASMDGTASRFAFFCGDERNPHQFKQLTRIATMEVDPPDLGEAPRVSDVTIEPTYLVPKVQGATVTARVETTNQLILVANAATLAGVPDASISHQILYDDGGRGGDKTAGDGTFTAPMWAESGAENGVRHVRVDAEVKGADGRRHATAVDVGPIPVLSEKPPETVASTPPVTEPPVTEPPTPPVITTPPVVATGMRIEAEHRRVSEGDLVHVPVWLKEASNVANVNFEVHYDTAVARPEGDIVKGNMLDRAIFSANPRETGRVQVGFAQTDGLAGTGTVAYLPMRAVGRAGDSTPLHLEVTTIDDPAGSVMTIQRIDGSIAILGDEAQLPGDCDGDGSITAADAMCALKMSVGNMSEDARMDVDENGRVTSGDARIILRRAVGLET